MAKIFYSVAGEGRGHATRARAMVEMLRHDHDLTLFAGDQAHDFLSRHYGPTANADVKLHHIDTLRFAYRGKKLDLVRTAGRALAFTATLPKRVRSFDSFFQSQQPDLVVSDFEPTLSRAAHRHRVPLVSLDHQHVFVASWFGQLPPRFRLYANVMTPVITQHCPGHHMTIVSSFFQPPIRPSWKRTTVPVGGLFRQDIIQGTPEVGGHLLVYLRRNSNHQRLLRYLHRLGRPARVYGLGQQPNRGSLTFCPIDEFQFRDDLLSCDAVISAAGHQLLSETVYLGKPVFAVPERDHFEQTINAHFLQKLGFGRWNSIETVTQEMVRDFITDKELYRVPGKRQALCGNSKATSAIEHMLTRPMGARIPLRLRLPLPNFARPRMRFPRRRRVRYS